MLGLLLASAAEPADVDRAIVVSWDGAGHALTSRLLAGGRLRKYLDCGL